MIVGSNTRQLLAIGSVCCAVVGLLLAASVMPMLASESPGKEFVDTEAQSMGASAERMNTADGPAGGGGKGTPGTADVTRANGDGTGTDRVSTTDSSRQPHVLSAGGGGTPDNSLIGGVLYGLASLLSVLNGGAGGEPIRGGATSATFDGFNVNLGGAFGTALAPSGGSSLEAADAPGTNRKDGRMAGAQSADRNTARTDATSENEPATGTPAAETSGSGDTGTDTGDTDEESRTDTTAALSDGGAATGALVALVLLVAGYTVVTRNNPIRAVLAVPGHLISIAVTAVVACSRTLEQSIAAIQSQHSIADLLALVLERVTDTFRSVHARVSTVWASISPFDDGVNRVEPDANGDPEPGARERIRLAFESVVTASTMRRSRVTTATPTEVANSATDAGAPDAPVTTITDSFRDVEYGDRDPASYLEATTDAHEQLRAELDTAEAETEMDDE